MRFATALLALVLLLVVGPAPEAHAQTLVVDGPRGPVLPTLTPRFTLRLSGVLARPLLYTLFISRSPNVEGSFVETVPVQSNDSIVDVIVSRLLPNGTLKDPISIYWKARVTLPNQTVIESEITGPRQVPLWLTLISPTTGTYDSRRPTFIFQSAEIDPQFGTWSYRWQIFSERRSGPEQSGFTLDTTFIPPLELEANLQLKWQVTALLEKSRDVATVTSASTFSIRDPSIPTTTLLYQNFPNPFPSANSFSTCFWFDVKVGGARVSLDILDTRGSLVKRIVTARDLPAGTYGRGADGSGSNCNGIFVWNGTATDGRSLPGGVYLARFTATGSPPLFKKILFKGR